MTVWQRRLADLRSGAAGLVWGGSNLLRSLAQKGLWPAAQRLLSDGAGRRWRVAGTQIAPDDTGDPAQGVVIAESDCLWGTLVLPAMPIGAIDAAVQEAMWRESPLPPEQMAAVWHAEPVSRGGGWQVDWGMCSRAHVAACLAALGLPEDAPVFLMRSGRAWPAAGPARQAFQASQRRQSRWAFALLGFLVVALAAAALLPLALKRQAVVRAGQYVGEVDRRGAAARGALDELRQLAGVADELRARAAGNVPLAGLLEQLSRALPDDTYLDRLEVNADAVRLVGLAPNAASVVSRLAALPGVAHARSVAASVRDESSGKERFTIELGWRSVEAGKK